MKKYIPYLIAALVGFHLRWIIRTERLELLHERRGHHRSSAVRSYGVVVQGSVPAEENAGKEDKQCTPQKSARTP